MGGVLGHRTARWRVLLAVTLAAVTGLAGCESPPTPRARLGSLPFPGLFTLYELADPQALGNHYYDPGLKYLFAEQDRGTIYTRRGGFLDIAHIRKAGDWARYYALRIEAALLEGRTELDLPAVEPTVYHLRLNLPTDWTAITDDERRELARHLSTRIGQRLSYLALTWHEVLTYYGYRSTLFIPEDASAFAYDDNISHLVGIDVAGRAMLHEELDYDQAFTRKLQLELERLEVVDPTEARQVIDRIRDTWWIENEPIKRDIRLARDRKPLQAWLAPPAPGEEPIKPAWFHLPDLSDVLGRDLRDSYEVQMTPNVWEWSRIGALFNPRPRRLRPDEHLPIIMQDIYAGFLRQYGPEFDRP